jgi:hypothetical protein
MDGSFIPSARDRRASLAELEAQITELAGQLNAAQYRRQPWRGFQRRRSAPRGSKNTRSPMDVGAPMRSPTWQRPFSPGPARRALPRLAPIAIKSWCTWTPRACASTATDAASLSRDRPSPSRRHAGSPAMRACSACWRTSTGSRSMWGARRAAFPPPSAAHCGPATPVAASPAAPTSGMWTRTTSSTGPTAGRPNSRTS